MNRRELVSVAAATGTALAFGRLALEASPALAAGPVAQKIADAAAHCIATGLACIEHCRGELAKGNKVMAECQANVLDTVAACEALQKLALADSKHLPAFAKACADICADCAKVCEQHAAHMEPCKACMESCKACEKACRAA
jgi:Cys-rich four helix bundle protein (predicted Tat secretion target)